MVETDADILAAIDVEVFPDGQAVSLEAIFGNSASFDEDGALSGAEAFMQSYSLRGAVETFTWEADYQFFMANQVQTFADRIKLTYLTSRSIDDALAASISGEIFLFALTYVIMVLFVQSVLGRCFAGHVQRRTCLGLGGVACVLAAGLAAYGVNSGFGIPFTSLVQVLPFILLGIGVDDMFVIVAAFDHTDPDLPVEERVALGLKRCGSSVTYTSLTNFVSFMLGSTSSLPAVEYFCLYAGTAILFDYFLQVTLFVALLAMDANRQKVGRIDCLCCFTSKRFKAKVFGRPKSHLTPSLQQGAKDRGFPIAGTAVGSTEDDNQEEAATVATAATTFNGSQNLPIASCDSDLRLGRMGMFMKDKYAPFLLSAKGKTLVFLGTAGLLATGIYGVTKAKQGFDVIDLAPDSHFARDHTEASKTYALEFDAQYIPLGIYTLDVDYTAVNVQSSIMATGQLMLEQTYVEGPLQSWIISFTAWANSSSEYSGSVSTLGSFLVYEQPDTFYIALADFLHDEKYALFKSSIIYDDDGLIKISRSGVFLNGITDTGKRLDSMLDARKVTDQSDLEPEPFAFTQIFVLTEQFLVIYDELIINFILALAAVAVLSLLILGKIGVIALVCFTVAMIDVELLGFVYHYGLEVNGITVIQLIMAVGLVVDYTAHIMHYFLHQNTDSSKDVQIANALGEVGPSVMLGAATTFLGIMPMAFASSFIFRVFFKIFILIIVFGFYHGVVFIPVALSLLPGCLVPPNRKDDLSSESSAGSSQSQEISETKHSVEE
ncbi:unnamed protein product [Ascophyllum nodosum]